MLRDRSAYDWGLIDVGYWVDEGLIFGVLQYLLSKVTNQANVSNPLTIERV